MTKDRFTVVLGICYSILVVLTWILIISFINFLGHLEILLEYSPFLILLIPGTMLFLIFCLSNEGTVSGRAGFYISLPVWIYSWYFTLFYFGGFSYIQLIYSALMIQLIICGTLLYWKSWQSPKDPDEDIREKLKKEGTSIGGVFSIFGGGFLVATSLVFLAPVSKLHIQMGLFLVIGMVTLVSGTLGVYSSRISGFFALSVGAILVVLEVLFPLLPIRWSYEMFIPLSYAHAIFGGGALLYGITIESLFILIGGILVILFASKSTKNQIN